MEKELLDEYKEIKKRADAFDAVFWLKSTDKNTRLTYLLKLSELIQPMGIGPMGQVLLDQNEDEIIRIQAIRGLKRFAKEWFEDQYWEQITEIFKEVLRKDDLPEIIKNEVIEALRRFNGESSNLLGQTN
jgi:hypothetical protein